MKTKDIQAQAKAFYANMHKAADRADQLLEDERERAAKAGEALMQWVRDMLVTTNPWEVLEKHARRVMTGDLCDEAMLLLLQDAERIVRKHEQALPELKGMAETITTSAQICIDQYKAAANTNRKAKRGEKRPLPKDLRPAEIYRRFAKPLRWLRDQGYVKAAGTLQAIMRAQTLPFEELDAPAWIDRYTLSVDPDADRPGAIKVRITEPVLDTEIAKKMVEDLGWDEGVVRTFLSAQEGFNAEDGLDEIMAAVDEDALGRLDDRKPQWMEIQEDCHPTKEIGIIRAEAKPWLDGCRALINELVKQANAEADMADRFWRTRFFQTVKQGFRESAEAKDFLDFLNEKAEEGAAVADIAVVFLSLQHGYGFEEGDAAEVRLHQVPNFRNLGEWLDFWGDELMEAMHDAPMRWGEIPLKKLDQYVEETTESILDKATHSSHIFRTRAFMEGYLKCMINAQTVTRYENGQKHDMALEAGWESFRQWKNPIGARLYHEARADGKTQKEAMASFWKEVRAEEKRIATGTVVQPKAAGLILNTGRFIPWKIALLKLQNNELHFPGNTRERIKKALEERGIGLAFAQAL